MTSTSDVAAKVAARLLNDPGEYLLARLHASVATFENNPQGDEFIAVKRAMLVYQQFKLNDGNGHDLTSGLRNIPLAEWDAWIVMECTEESIETVLENDC
jgi:hypothetical protein